MWRAQNALKRTKIMEYRTKLDKKVIDAAMARGHELRSAAYHELLGAIGNAIRRGVQATFHVTAPYRVN
jgi:hypothetical protein